MKRLTCNLSIALIAFLVGLTSQLAFDKYLEVTSARLLNYVPTQATSLRTEGSGVQVPPASLPAELKRIDEKYRTRCQLPTYWSGDWATIKQLARFRSCNDEWATTRREAIQTEIANYMIRY